MFCKKDALKDFAKILRPDQDGGRWKQQHQHTTFKLSYFLGIIIERIQKQHIMTS